MRKLSVCAGLCTALLYVCVMATNVSYANTLSGYAIRQSGRFINQRVAGALVEFSDASTGKPASIKVKMGTRVDKRKDALYALASDDIGKWEVDIKPGRYIVKVTTAAGSQSETYSLTLSALTACSTSTGFLDVTTCGAIGNGSTDNTQAILDGVSAITAAGGGKLFFPKGRYVVGNASQLPIVLPSGITIEGVNGGYSDFTTGNCQLILGSPSNPTAVNGKQLFKIGENKRHITFRDIMLVASNFCNTTGCDASVPNSTAVLAQGNAPNSTFETLFSNMTFLGFGIDVDVKRCNDGNVVNGNCLSNPNDPTSHLVPWQFDNVKADRVAFGGKIGVRMDTENTDWNFSSCWFHMPADGTPGNEDTWTTMGLHLIHAGFIEITNSFGGSDIGITSPGGTFIYAEMVAGLQIVNSQAENVENSIVYGRPTDPQYPYWDLGTTIARIIITGSEFDPPIKMRQRGSLISTGNRYRHDTLRTFSPLVRIYSMGDKFCLDGFGGSSVPCPNPGISGPGKVVFQTGYPAETSGNPTVTPTPASNIVEAPTRFGLPVEVNGGDGTRPYLKVTGNINNSKPLAEITSPNTSQTLLRLGQGEGNFYYDFRRNGDNGFLEIKSNHEVPYMGVILNGALQLDPNLTFVQLTDYGTRIFNNQPVIKNGALLYCADCKANVSTGVCEGNGTGAMAKRINGSWMCN